MAGHLSVEAGAAEGEEEDAALAGDGDVDAGGGESGAVALVEEGPGAGGYVEPVGALSEGEGSAVFLVSGLLEAGGR